MDPCLRRGDGVAQLPICVDNFSPSFLRRHETILNKIKMDPCLRRGDGVVHFYGVDNFSPSFLRRQESI
jgi:hypothetical protein